MVIGDCGCWIIRSYADARIILRFSACGVHTGVGLADMEELLYIDRVDSVSAPEEEEAQLWLT